MFKITSKPKPIVLCILDGWGIAPDSPGNAITRANPQNFNRLWFSYPHTLLNTAGQQVGLPAGEVGNSEVGHINLGAGKIVYQSLLKINLAIADGIFFENGALLGALEHIDKYKSTIHLMGLVGFGSVHSELDHLYALLHFLKENQIPSRRVKLHLFTDGRDCPPTSAPEYIKAIQDKLEKEGLGQIASLSGRYYAMDRDNRWDRTQKAYLVITGQSANRAQDPQKVLGDSYQQGKADEFIEPVSFVDPDGKLVGPVAANDAVIFFNYRPDRARQLTKAFVLDKFDSLVTASGEKVTTFTRGPKIANVFFVTLTQYEANLPVSAVAFKPEEVAIPLARVFAERNLRQLHIAETEKYAHVTYFFNGGREQPFLGEDRILIDSQKVATYDLKPEMSTPEIAKKILSRIENRLYDFIVVNFANADMVAHTGKIEQTIIGVKTIDFYLGLLAKSTLNVGGALIITADHGNAEEMINEKTGKVDTEHNGNPAPCIFAFHELEGKPQQLQNGLLADVAPTILSVLNIPKPSQMTGRNLLE